MNTLAATILPTAYLPPISWCTHFWNAANAVLEAHEHYQKGATRNRAQIAGPNGAQLLSIPLLKGKHQQTPVREVRIAYTATWQRQHWRSICTAYGNAPYFEHYADGLAPFYQKKYDFLFDFNLELIHFVLIKQLGWQGALTMSPQFIPNPPLLPETTQKFYPQVFLEKNGFMPNLSILDLLLCCGKQATAILRNEAPVP